MPASPRPPCEVCQRPASFIDSAVPTNKQGANHPNECGYREQALCFAHGIERKRHNTARVRELILPVCCDTCAAKWEDNFPNEPTDVIWCGSCNRTTSVDAMLDVANPGVPS